MSRSSLRSSKGKERVMVIALDGATWDLARPWTEAGLMPQLERLLAKGVSAGLRAELPPSSVPNWPAFMTGKNAGKHSCVWWLKRDETGRRDSTPIDSRSVAGDTIWSHLSAHGKKVIVQNVPVTYPVEPVNGILISGLLTPRSANDFVFPADFKHQLDLAVDGYKIYPDQSYARGREQTFVDGQIANIRQHTKAAEFLLQTRDWDFFILVLGPTDEVAHKCWHYLDSQHPLYRKSEAVKFKDSIQSVYRSADETIGTLSGFLTEHDTLIVMSDHGFGPVDGFFHINNWLMREGYLKLKRSGATRVKQALFHTGFTPRNIFPLGKQLLSFLPGTQGLRQRLDPGRQGRKSPLRRIFLTNEDIDWSHTRVFATGFLYSQLYINLQERDPGGIVAPADYEPLREQLIQSLSTLTNPAMGKTHYARIYRREEIYAGPFLDLMPDLLCVPRDLRTADSGMGFRSNKLFDADSSITGTHREEGIFAMQGPGVRSGVRIPPIRIYDLAPTILYRLGLPIPDDLDGSIISAAFEEAELAARKAQFSPAQPTRVVERKPLKPEEEEAIQKRLRDLGYLS